MKRQLPADCFQPESKRIKRSECGPLTPSTADIKKRAKHRMDELKNQKVKEEQENKRKDIIRQQVTEIIKTKARKAKNAIHLIRILCPTLDIDESITSKANIKKAFKKALLQTHPDRVRHKTLRERVECEEIFKILCAQKQALDKKSDCVRNANKTHCNRTNKTYDKYFRNKIWTSSNVDCYDVTITLLKNKNMIYVRGKTFGIKENIKRCGFGWNHTEKAWQMNINYYLQHASIQEELEWICADDGLSLSVNVEDIQCVDVKNKNEDKNYDFRIWFDKNDSKILVTPHRKMNAFWRNEGFIRSNDGLWMQAECVFYEGYLNVIKDMAQNKGLVFGYCDAKKDPLCKHCNKQMRIYTTKNGASWNIGRKFFKCWKCDTFIWIDGTQAYSDAAFRRCGECEDSRFGFDHYRYAGANGCTIM